MSEDLLSPCQLAKYSGWPVGRIRTLIAKRAIRHVRIGGGFYLPKTAVDEYLAKHMVEPEREKNSSIARRSGNA